MRLDNIYNPLAVIPRKDNSVVSRNKGKDITKATYNCKDYYLIGNRDKSRFLSKLGKNSSGNYSLKHNSVRINNCSRYNFQYDYDSNQIWVFPTREFFDSKKAKKLTQDELIYLRKEGDAFFNASAPEIELLY